ncbi:hypothetical protein FQZ97_883290 [compost metagenome]
MQLIAHDLDIGALLRQRLAEVPRKLLSMGVVLVQQVHAFQLRLRGHEKRQRARLHGGVGIDAEVPEAAQVVGQRRVHGRVVDVEHRLLGVARVVPRHRIGDRRRHPGAIALHDVAKALVDGGLERVQAFLGRALVVKARHHKTHARRIARAGQLLGHELPAAQAVAANVGRRAGERVDERDAHHLLRRIGGPGQAAQTHPGQHTQRRQPQPAPRARRTRSTRHQRLGNT